jgi:hypothetical protein
MINRSDLLKDLQRELPKIEKDILEYSAYKEGLAEHLKEEYEKAQAAGRTAEHFVAWREAQITQAAVAWLLTCVFVRFLEDNNLLVEPMLSGPASSNQNGKETKPLQHAKERMVAFFNENPTLEERDYLLDLFAQLERFPVIAELLDHRHNPLWQIPVSSDGAKALIDFFQKIDADTGEVIHDFTDADWDTRFLGDLYQDLSESVRKRYALLQTPEFVESFILDYTLEKAKDTFGLPGLRLIDPTCGSGHFLLTTFERMFDAWQKREPATNTRELAQRALDVVHGVDINPYAIAICRFRLFIAAMKAAGSHKVKDAPDFHFNLACGDSLLHGRRFEGTSGLQASLMEEDEPLKHVLDVEDLDKLNKILGQQYHAVVGNPPYIVVRDKALNLAYREKYPTCHRQYSLGVPFTERFFDLALAPTDRVAAGFMGIITANSFMKREFGTKLIQNYLVWKDLTHIVDTSGAYIPGHGTPTVILFARNQKPSVESSIRLALGVKAEPATPINAKEGLVWRSIVDQIDKGDSENEYVSIEDKDRSLYLSHPWSLTGGGALELKQYLDRVPNQFLNNITKEIGFLCITRADDIYSGPKSAFLRYGISEGNIVVNVDGETVRDWELHNPSHTIFPYDKDLTPTKSDAVKSFLWPYRTDLWLRREPNGNHKELGLTWYEWSRFQKKRFKNPLSITFAEIASHNHFVFDRGGKAFKQTAPIIKLDNKSTEADYLLLQAYLNSSSVCFLMKQTSHQKQLTGGDGVRIEFVSKVPYQYAGTALKKIPVPNTLFGVNLKKLMANLSTSIDRLILESSKLTPAQAITQSLQDGRDVASTWANFKNVKSMCKSREIFLQEELDWTVYCAFGLCNENVLIDVEAYLNFYLNIGERPFEILAQLNQDGYEVPKKVPEIWPDDIKAIWQARIEMIIASREIKVLEDPHYKRRWVGRQGLFNKSAKLDELQVACKEWMLEHIEINYCKNNEALSTCGQLADKLRSDDDFNEVAKHYTGNELFDIQKLISELVEPEHAPQFSAGRYKPKAMSKFRAWQETWDKQRQEDAIDAEFGVDQPLSDDDAANEEKVAAYEVAKAKAAAKKAEVVGDIPIPPKYAAGDFRKPSYWSLRGKLDVPKERFFSLPGCEKDGDSTLVIGWAGMNHLQRATAIATWYLDRKETDGWEAEKLKPMLVALDELIPWLKQWHNDIDPEFGERMGDYYEGFLLEEMRTLDVTKDDLLAWEPPAAPKKKAAKKKTTAKKNKPKSASAEVNDTDASKEQG